MAVAHADIDDFKLINDTHGHPFGDKVLRLAVRIMKDKLPPGAALARRGGDEFALLLPQMAPEEALLILEDVRRELGDRKHRVDGKTLMIPLSIGLAGFPHHAENPSRLMEAADQAQERAKREGKNRIAMYVEEKMVLKSNYYPRAQLARLSALAEALGRTEASLLREALGNYLDRHRGAI